MALKSATYIGMNLKGEIRESVSLDDDDMSDVEDEVFIRDGKNGFKLAEDLNVKRPLMAPRRRKYESGLRLRPKPNCRAWCKPCCYILASLSIIISLIVLVVVLVSIYPLPLDRLRDWVLTKPTPEETIKKLPCTGLKVTEIYSKNFPNILTDSPIRTVDTDGDGTDDLLVLGFGSYGNNILPPEVYCPMIIGVDPPCDGGVLALNAKTGLVRWEIWLNDTIFGVHCSEDVNVDGVNDCLAVGVDGTIAMFDSKTGRTIWKIHSGKMNIFVANFIDDQNGDNISDVITSHSSLSDSSSGHIILLSGRNGDELKRVATPNRAKTFFMPQKWKVNATNKEMLLVGTGTPNTPGNLSIVEWKDFDSLTNSSTTIYLDKFRGVLTQSILVDITGDRVLDIVNSMYNSTIVAIDGKTLEPIWNYTVPGGVTDMVPTPAYFNSDNVSDFLVVYQKYDKVINSNYTQTLIIDGVSGKLIFPPISGSVITQMSGLTLSMDDTGNDMYLLWSSEYSSTDTTTSKRKTDVSDEYKKQYNSSTILKLNAVNQVRLPPGMNLYSSALKMDEEFKEFKSPIDMARDYLIIHGPVKDGKSNFRHKDRPDGIVRDFNPPDDVQNPVYYMANRDDLEFSNYNVGDDNIPYNQKQVLFGNLESNNKYPKGKTEPTKKKNLSDKIYGYHNVKLSKDRLLRDEDSLPIDILRDTYFQNEESRLRKMKFEQRDVNAHLVGNLDDAKIKKIIEKQKNETEQNRSTTLWDIETENELHEREDQGYLRRKRDVLMEAQLFESISRVTSVGAVLPSFDASNSSNTIDLVFVKYWQSIESSQEVLMNRYIDKCISSKVATQEGCEKELDGIRGNFPFFNQLHQLPYGQMTIYRLSIRCDCDSTYNPKIPEKCAKFLNQQNWGQYLGKSGNGVFN